MARVLEDFGPRFRPARFGVGPIVALAAALLPSAALPACSSEDELGEGDGGGADAGVPEPEQWQHGVISITEHAASHWHVALEGEDVVAHHATAGLALLVDPTGGQPDGRYAGVYVHQDGNGRFQGRYHATDCSTFVPDRPWIDQESVEVVAEGASLTITMLEGSLSEIPDSEYTSDEPFRWRSAWSVNEGGLRIDAEGLYYLLPAKDACAVTLRDEGGAVLDELELTADSQPFLEYFDGVRAIEVASPMGSFRVATDAQILQIEVPSYPDTQLFELDFDHSFKERGQSDIRSEVHLSLAP